MPKPRKWSLSLGRKAFAILAIFSFLRLSSAMDALSPIKFKLEKPEFYFPDPQSRALLSAALAGNLANAMQLLANGASVDAEGPPQVPNRLRLLHFAIASNNKDAVRVLLKAGADPQLNTLGSGSAFLFALTLNDMQMLAILLDHKSVKELSADTLEDLMFEAIIQGRSECIKLLLQRGAPIDFKDGAGYTVFMRSMNAQHFDMAEYLLAAGASITVETPSGSNPANLVQYAISQYKPGTKTYIQLRRMQQYMADRGVMFPVPHPEEVRASRKR